MAEILKDTAFRRAAWHSGAANYSNTAHLVTSGIAGELAPGVECAWTSPVLPSGGPDGAGEEWLCIDLGAETEIVSVIVHWGASFATAYRVQISDDGARWKDAARAAGTANAAVETPLGGVTAYRVRILCEACSGDRYVIRSVKIPGRNSLEYSPAPPPVSDSENRRTLAGGWKIERAAQVPDGGVRISTADYDDSAWLPAAVPGTALVSYLKAGAIPDPDYDDWQFQVSEDFFTAPFWYRREFELDPAARERRVFLNFDMINWKADIFLNGQFLPNSDPARKHSIEGAFVRGQFDVTDLLQSGGKNALAVLIHKNDTPGAVTGQGLAEGPLPNGGALGADNPTLHAAVGWDWLPTIRGRDTGIIEEVFLSFSGPARLCDPWMETRLAVTEKSAALSAENLALRPGVSVSPPDAAVMFDGSSAQWIAPDIDGAECTIDLGEELTAGSVTIVWGTEAGGRAADLESRHPAQFSLESSADGKDWVNFNSFSGGKIDAMFFGQLDIGPQNGTDAFEGHSISDSIQGSTAVAEIDFGALGWGEGKVPIPFFSPRKVRYIRFKSLERRTVNGAKTAARIREFRIYAESVQQVEQSLVREFSVDDSRAALVFRTEVKNSGSKTVEAAIKGRIVPGNIPFEKTVTLPPGAEETVEIDGIVMEKPRLWWPNTYGEPFLYTAETALSVDGVESDRASFKFGVRQFSYPVDGGLLTLYCNGTRIVCKGGTWGMDDGLKRDTPEIYDNKVRLHAEANLVMIRNWVGMTNHPAFYEACDKYGVLVWDDFWLANPVDGPDPNDSEMFLRNAVDKIRRNRRHAALALYCGRNEANPPENIDAGLRERTAQYDGTRFYFPNSAMPPVGSGGGYSLAIPGGNNGVKQYFNDVTSPVLRSERGIPNVPALESIKKFVAPEHLWPISETWALHDWTYHMNGPANTYMSTLKLYMDGAFTVPVDTVRDQNPKADDPVFQAYKKEVLNMVKDAGAAYSIEDFSRMAQMINYDNHRGLFEALCVRRANGLLMWMSQSSWPSFMWQTCDWYLDTNGGYFGTKAGNQPVHAVFDPRDNSITAVNATPEHYGSVSVDVSLYDLHGNRVTEKTFTLEKLAADSYGIPVARADFSASPTDLVFLKLVLRDAGGNILGENLYWHNRAVYQDYRALNTLAKADVKITVTARETLADGNIRCTLALENSGAVPAVQTRIRTLCAGEAVLPVFYSDNYFALMPGGGKTVTAEFRLPAKNGGLTFALSGWNTAEKSAAAPDR
jgi:hypothetical protein